MITISSRSLFDGVRSEQMSPRMFGEQRQPKWGKAGILKKSARVTAAIPAILLTSFISVQSADIFFVMHCDEESF